MMLKEPIVWYMDNRAYFSQKFVDDFLSLVIRITTEGYPVNGATIKKYYPEDGNASSRATGARDFGLINENSKLGDSASLYSDGVLPYPELALELMIKRNTSKNLFSTVKPVVILCKFFQLINLMDITEKDKILTIYECYKYLCAITDYDEINAKLVYEIVKSRKYKEEGVPVPCVASFSNSVYLSSLFSCLNDTGLLKFGKQKSILQIEPTSFNLVEFIANNGDRITLAPCIGSLKSSKTELYEYLCDIKKGFLEIIPDIHISGVVGDKELFEYLFGIGDRKELPCFKVDCFGIYKSLYKVRHLVFEKIGIIYPELRERLYEYDSHNRYIVSIEDGKIIIMPFGNSEGNLYIK